MVWAIALAAVLLFSPTYAYAVEGESYAESSQESPGNSLDVSSIESRLTDLQIEIQRQNDTITTLLSTIEVTLSNIERYMEPKTEEKKLKDEKDTEDYLISIDEHLSDIGSKLSEPEQQEQKSVSRAQSYNFVCYANVPSTGTYSTYAAGLLPKMRWDEHYCFFQDTSSSYTIVWGDTLEYSGNNTFVGTSCHYVRWYYSGQQYGYQTESGTGDISISTSGHVVLSDLASYPMLDGSEQHSLRMEVALYACVALVIRTLHHVWRFTLRNGNGTMAD